MTFDAFISYSSKDKTAADATCAFLENAGVRCWIAPRDIRPGGEYGAAIVEAIERCRVMVLIFSAGANESHEIHREVERGVSKGIPIVPLRIEEITPTKSLEYFLGAIHWLDALTPPLEKHLHKLAGTVKAILSADVVKPSPSLQTDALKVPDRPAPVDAAARKAESVSPQPRVLPGVLVGVLGGGFCVALLLGGLWLYQNCAPALAVAPPLQQASIGQSFRDPRADGRPCLQCPEMTVVPAGEFMMGGEPGRPANEVPRHRVAIPKSLAVGKFAITYEEWDACVTGGGCASHSPSDYGFGRGRQPVKNVGWIQAKSYAAWLSQTTGKSYRLLSEAEREYVTRAGTTTPFWWGTTISTDQANYTGASYAGGPAGENRKQTVPVDSFKPNPWGLYQVHGNVWEWAEDCWNDNHDGAPSDGSARSTGDCLRHVLRGGSYINPPTTLIATVRAAGGVDPTRGDVGGNAVGFRVIRAATP